MRVLLISAWLLGGCVPAPPAPPTDDQRYQAALTGPLDPAPAGCDTITSPRLQGDCQSAVATRFAAAGRYAEAQAQCDRILDPLWHDECWFGIADAAGLVGEAADAACAKANRYHSFCRRHALQRTIAQRDIPVGTEPEAVRRFGGDVEALMPGAAPRIVQHTANTLVAEALSRRWARRPFDPALCGALTEALCQHAYWFTATRLLGEMRAVCAAEDLGAAVEAAGLSGHTEAGAPTAEAVWDALCAQIDAGALVPEEIGAAVPASLDGGMLPVE